MDHPATFPATLMRSPPPPPWRGLVLAVIVLWVAPAILGGILLAVFALAGQVMGEVALALWAIAMALLFSPFLSWIGWALALPIVWLLLERGRFGYLPAGLVGLVAGALAARIVSSELATGFGVAMLLALRAILWRIGPAARAG
ncbi:MAG: hypothetical protein KF887_08850 [Paracoccaceae bacterium]|nr:MAG: hypothetical protein KF887_08850 [Paracoccaceae bacterium]